SDQPIPSVLDLGGRDLVLDRIGVELIEQLLELACQQGSRRYLTGRADTQDQREKVHAELRQPRGRALLLVRRLGPIHAERGRPPARIPRGLAHGRRTPRLVLGTPARARTVERRGSGRAGSAALSSGRAAIRAPIARHHSLVGSSVTSIAICCPGCKVTSRSTVR